MEVVIYSIVFLILIDYAKFFYQLFQLDWLLLNDRRKTQVAFFTVITIFSIILLVVDFISNYMFNYNSIVWYLLILLYSMQGNIYLANALKCERKSK